MPDIHFFYKRWLYYPFFAVKTKNKFKKKTWNYFSFWKKKEKKKAIWGKIHLYHPLPWLFALNAVMMSGGVVDIWKWYFNTPIARKAASCRQWSRTLLIKLLSGYQLCIANLWASFYLRSLNAIILKSLCEVSYYLHLKVSVAQFGCGILWMIYLKPTMRVWTLSFL